jgi:hypothetical protein
MLRRWSLNACLIVASTFIALLPFETYLRLQDGVPLLEFSNFIGDRVDKFKSDTSLIYDDTLGWRPQADWHGPSYDTGAYGVRATNNAERAVAVGGILASGDSFTFGTDVGNAESWPAFLEAMTGTPVINAGAPGWGTDQIVMRAEQMIGAVGPQTLIVGFLWYDIGRAEESINFGAHKPYDTVEDGELVLHGVPVPRFASRADEIGVFRAILGHSYAIGWAAQRLGFERWAGVPNAEHKRATPGGTGQKVTGLLMKRLKARAEAGRIRLMMVMQYSVGDFDRAQPQAALAVVGYVRELGIDAIDTWAALAEIHDSDPARFRSLFLIQETGWSHMSAAGNRLIASIIAAHLNGEARSLR